MLSWAIVAFYAMFCLTALLNLLLMKRPSRSQGGPNPLVLIPARNEEHNLAELLPILIDQVGPSGILVFDDESEDQTAQVAQKFGVRVITPPGALQLGWTGKNRACYELAKAASERDEAWWLFLDADTRPAPNFISALNSLCEEASPKVGMITGFPHILPGRGIEPIFLAWVGWVLLATNPYGLVSRTGIGHNRFKNGQVHCWRREVYQRLQPNQRVSSQIMEDVMIGRLLANEGIAVKVANLSSVLKVRMYDHWRQTFDGMSKNSFEITGTVWGSLIVAGFFLFVAWGWLLAGDLKWLALLMFFLSGLWVCVIARAPWWPLLFGPVAPIIGAITIIRSTIWHQQGSVRWKGRVYSREHLQKPAP